MVADSNPVGHSPATSSRLGSAGTEPNKQDNHQDHEKVHESNNTHDSGTHSHRRPLSLPLFGKTADHAKAALKRRSVGLFARQANKENLEVIQRDLAENRVKPESAHDDLETMDRRGGAMGPRAPVLSNVNPAHGDDQRTQAFESIFGRPSAAHRDVQAYPQMRPQQMNTPSYYPQQYQQQVAQSRPYQPQSLPHQPQSLPQHQYARPQRTPEPPHGYPYEYSRSNYQPSFISATNGVVMSPPAPPVDPSLESLTNTGLTPAQAYQAQVFANNHQRMGLPPGAHPPHTQNGSPLGRASSMTTSPPPRLDSLNIQENGGRLSLDFIERDTQPVVAVEVLGNSREKLESEEDGDSELPWINAGQRTPTGSQKATGSSQPQHKSYSNSSSTRNSIDIHDFRSTGPPKLNLDFGTSPPFSSQTFGDSGPNRRLSIEASKILPPINLSQANTGSTTPSSLVTTPSSSASSSYARRSLPSETPRTRTPLSQLSFAASNATSTAMPSPAQNSGPGTPVSQLSAQPTRRGPKRAPLVYPALLSRVAEALLQRLPLSVRTKHGLSYPDAFDGREAVDKICYIIKTTDRSLALLLGRALDAQKFFHDVTYDHRLRDNSNEIYQFKSSVRGLKLSDSSTSGTILGHARGDSKSVSPNTSISGSSHRPSTSKASTQDSSASSNDHGAPHHYQSATEATVLPASNQSSVSQSYISQQVEDHVGVLMEEPVDEMELPTG
ncbi:DEP-domain-containing protein, partial [Serendipita vermifera]